MIPDPSPDVLAPRTGLARAVRVADLAAAVASQRSWRGVLREFGFTTSRTARVLRAACDELGIDYRHFRQLAPSDNLFREVIPEASTWPEALERLGYSPGSGSARATVRKHCARLGISWRHLTLLGAVGGSDVATSHAVRTENLRFAGPYVVAARLTLAGHRVSFAPEGAAYDLLVDAPNEGIRRVQVKTTTQAAGGSWPCNLTRSTYDPAGHGGHTSACYTSEDVDVFACVNADLEIYLIPISVVEGTRSICLRRYANFRIGALGGLSSLS